jgi:mRNA interferase YafQ
MSFRKLLWTKKFSEDVKRAKMKNKDLESLQKVIKMLQQGDTLRHEYKPHPLKGKYSDYMKYHIESDWLLI